MDMMVLRRMVMSQMAQSGANFTSGSFTITSNATNPYVLEFGKTFSKYIFYIEATGESKQQLYDTSLSGRRCYASVGHYPKTEINNTQNNKIAFAWTYVPSTGAVGNTESDITATDSTISFPCINISQNNQNALIRGLTYNYFICEIPN